jgi:hypothetical protein
MGDCKKCLRIRTCAANGNADLELGRGTRRVKVLCTAAKYWQRILRLDKEDLVKMCYEWQINSLESGSWAEKLRERLSKIRVGYIWQDLSEITVSGSTKKSKTGAVIQDSRICSQTLRGRGH